jgi:hypothetical protein
MSDITKVLAPNGLRYTFHLGTQRLCSLRLRGFVYVHGRRVYGTITDPQEGRSTSDFHPVGKWAHLVQADR